MASLQLPDETFACEHVVEVGVVEAVSTYEVVCRWGWSAYARAARIAVVLLAISTVVALFVLLYLETDDDFTSFLEKIDCIMNDCNDHTPSSHVTSAHLDNTPIALSQKPIINISTQVDRVAYGPRINSGRLQFLSNRLYLWTMLPVSETVLLYHFLQHYSSLGVDVSSKAQFAIHVNSSSTRAQKDTLKAVFKQFNVPKNNLQYISSYSADVKTAMVNSWARKLPKKAWFIQADLDEFFEFPSNIETLIESGKSSFAGEMEEYVGPNLSFPMLKNSPSIAEQYPIRCPRLRRVLSKGSGVHPNIKKIMLFKLFNKGTRRVILTHRLRENGKDSSFHMLGGFRHYYYAPAEFNSIMKAKMYQPDSNPYRQRLYAKMMSVFDARALKHDELKLTSSGRRVFGKICHVRD